MSRQNDFDTAKTFFNFMVDYYALVRRHIVSENQFRIFSHGFSLLNALKSSRDEKITMTKFADEIGVTKQQLTKLVNDLESQNLVRRSLNTENRRQVYIEITDEGIEYLDKMIDEILAEIVDALGNFDDEEKIRISDYAIGMSDIFERDAMHRKTAKAAE